MAVRFRMKQYYVNFLQSHTGFRNLISPFTVPHGLNVPSRLEYSSLLSSFKLQDVSLRVINTIGAHV
jgi:hypothetical protein